MPNAPRQLPSPVGILDNRSRGMASDLLRAHLQEGTELSVVSAYFTISAYEALREELERVERMRFLYGAPQHLRALSRKHLRMSRPTTTPVAAKRTPILPPPIVRPSRLHRSPSDCTA